MLTDPLKSALDQIAADYNPDMWLLASGSYLGDARRALDAAHAATGYLDANAAETYLLRVRGWQTPEHVPDDARWIRNVC